MKEKLPSEIRQFSLMQKRGTGILISKTKPHNKSKQA
jgi:hypothetical protein